MAHESEPSVEEILESIKKVIARDNRASALDARKRRELAANPSEAALIAEPADDIARLHTAHPHTVRDEVDVLDLADMELGAGETLPEPETETETDEAGEDTPLIGQAVREAMQENLAALAMLAEPGVRPQIVRSGETSLEGLTRDLLRPMLAEWLDAHLPAMVERMVQTEIARIVGKRM
jgi:cell pole-organizing protein PopZ